MTNGEKERVFFHEETLLSFLRYTEYFLASGDGRTVFTIRFFLKKMKIPDELCQNDQHTAFSLIWSPLKSGSPALKISEPFLLFYT